MSEAAFKLVYDGEAVRDGEMDVTDLAPALLSMGQLLKAAGRLANGDESDVRVRVKTMVDGSFEVWLNLALKHASEAWQAYKTSPEEQATVTAIGTAAGLLALLGFTAKDGVVAIVRGLRGKRPRRVDAITLGVVEIEADDGTVLVVPDLAYRLALDPSVRAALERVIAQPLEKDGIDTVLLGDAHGGQLIKKDEGEYFRAPLDSGADEFIARQTKMFSITSLSFKAGRKWRLNDGHGSSKLVTVSDQDFIDRIERSEIAFAKGDLLVCEVIERSRRTNSGGFRSEYEIVRVLEHRPPSRQSSMIA